MGPCGKAAPGHEDSNHTSGCSYFAISLLLSESGWERSAGFISAGSTLCVSDAGALSFNLYPNNKHTHYHLCYNTTFTHTHTPASEFSTRSTQPPHGVLADCFLCALTFLRVPVAVSVPLLLAPHRHRAPVRLATFLCKLVARAGHLQRK